MLARLERVYRASIARSVEQGRSAPAEAVVLRALGFAWLVALIVVTFTTRPHPGLQGRGVIVIAGLAVTFASGWFARPQVNGPPGSQPVPARQTRTVLALLGITAGSIMLALAQPNGIWLSGPYFVAIAAAITLDRRWGAIMLVAGIAPFTIGALVSGHVGSAISSSIEIVPWYLILRLMRLLGQRNSELESSRAAEAQAAIEAERSRIARELHDVLAHSLSALALQLESTRLLASDRGSDREVVRAIDQAHSLAATGLDDARRVVAATRGDELPGPERLEALAGAFGDQSGVPVAIEVSGEPRELAPDARVAVYRTAQEALTNVRRHATAARVHLRLEYLSDRTVLVVEDHGAAGAPAPVAPDPAAGGYGLTGMRERAKLLGGELFASPTANGFRVELQLPA